jgi:hypothetical protein
MKALTWEAIRQRYGIDVSGLSEADPETICAVVDPAGVFWRSRNRPRDTSKEIYLIRLLRATPEPEFLYLEVHPDRIPSDALGLHPSELANLLVGPDQSAGLPDCRHYVLRPLRSGERAPDPGLPT